MKITKNQILGLIRQLVTMVGAILASYGMLEVGGTPLESILGFVLIAVPTIWGFIDKSNKDVSSLLSLARHGLSVLSGVLIYALPQYGNVIGIIIPSITQMLAILLTYGANSDINVASK